MIGSSRASLADVRERVNAHFGNPGLAEAGRQLLQVADLFVRERPLLNAVADAGRPADERAGVMRQLLADRVGELALDFTVAIAQQRWSSDADIVDAFEIAGADALFGAAESAGQLDRVENELFRFGRILVSDGGLQLALSSPALPAAAKTGILTDLLGDRAAPVTLELLSFVSSHLRGRGIEQAVDQLTELAAERRGQLVAVVRCAQPLTQEQSTRLKAALARIYSRSVTLNIELEPALIGGISVQVGDEVFDGSVAGRLETARRRMTG